MAENLTLSLPGQKALSGESDALFMKTFTGEVMTAFEERNVMKDLHRVRTIDHGKSASFALLGKAAARSERVEVLSRRSIREKLLCYFGLQTGGDDCGSFHLPFTLSALAAYISADRSAMMRELRKMKEEHLVDIDRGQVTLHHALA